MPIRTRDLRRAATESAMLEAAWLRYAEAGPDGTSLRDVARDARCSHALVARYFGSKRGLSDAVLERLERRIRATVDSALAGGGDPAREFLTAVRRDRPSVRLLVRVALGDFGPVPGRAAGEVVRVVAATGPQGPGAAQRRRRDRLCTYGAASLLLGWLTYEDFVAAGTRLAPVGPARRDRAIAASAHVVTDVARARTPSLRGRLRVDRSRLGGGEAVAASSETALLAAAVELFAQRGPASVSVRDVGRRARVNQGLIYRHFGSKQALLAAAFEQGSSDLFPAALAPGGFDIDTVVHGVHHGARSPSLIARILVDGYPIDDVRRQFPILGRLLEGYERVPSGQGPGDPTDPRIAVAAVACMAMGSAVYGRDLRDALGLPDDGSTEVAVAGLCRVLLAVPGAR